MARTGAFIKVEGIINSYKPQSILVQNFEMSASKPKMKRNLTFQHDNDPKCTSKPTKEWLHQEIISAFEWPSQSSDLKPTTHLWGDLKQAVHRKHSHNLTDQECFCKKA